MEPQCHPRLENETDLEAQQAAFFDSSLDSSAKLVKSSNPKRPVVLSDVIERSNEQATKPVTPPTARPPPQSKLFSTKPKPSVATSELQEISKQNDELLASMSKEEILALQEEMRTSIPEFFLRKLEHKRE